MFKIGDEVKVVKKCKSYENDWVDSWVLEMNDFVGKKCIISNKCRNSYGLKDVFGDEYWFPDFVLKKIKKSYLPDDLFSMEV